MDKDANGLYTTKTGDDKYIKNYFNQREVPPNDNSFLQSIALGYMTDDPLLGTALGGNAAGAILGSSLNNKDNYKHATTHTSNHGTHKHDENFS